jgi:hypothetical protein
LERDALGAGAIAHILETRAAHSLRSLAVWTSPSCRR